MTIHQNGPVESEGVDPVGALDPRRIGCWMKVGFQGRTAAQSLSLTKHKTHGKQMGAAQVTRAATIVLSLLGDFGRVLACIRAVLV